MYVSIKEKNGIIFFQYKFIMRNLVEIKTLDDLINLIRIFDESLFEESKEIKYGSCITLKHVSNK